ncbi:DUF6193 family natural product biosynthesis protein [Streptomyces sp. CA-132043]|uniref:DUF6193 family natural product biosynthesis protein n=1 Tax=Streptomyces sp. CA-132043 TaxID=3240048 RepID=UPI003D924CE6
MDGTTSSHDRVEAGWQHVRADGRVRSELLEAAYAEPRLHQLFPWTGMGELHFSRCTEPRWTWDVPYIQPAADGRYRVSGPRRGESIGPAATPEQAVAMVVENLPPGCGPAFLGTPEELAAHDAGAARRTSKRSWHGPLARTARRMRRASMRSDRRDRHDRRGCRPGAPW